MVDTWPTGVAGPQKQPRLTPSASGAQRVTRDPRMARLGVAESLRDLKPREKKKAGSRALEACSPRRAPEPCWHLAQLGEVRA